MIGGLLSGVFFVLFVVIVGFVIFKKRKVINSCILCNKEVILFILKF